MTISLISACSLNSVIGSSVTNTLPWANKYPADMKFFRERTAHSTIIMGRKTMQSIGRALPKRNNFCVSRDPHLEVPEGISIKSSVEEAILHSQIKSDYQNTWLIGGSYIYQEGLQFADEIYITTIPEVIKGDGLVYFPYVNPHQFAVKETLTISQEEKLVCTVYKRI